MEETVCLPFFHPTRVVFVDDDRSFLEFFPRSLGPGIPVSRYDSPRKLLADLAAGRIETRIDLKCWTSYSGGLGDQDHEHMLGLDTAMIFMRVFARQRFGSLSVAVIDFDMPEMDGLDLCHAISDLPCRKILLTGQATESQAVAAFNEGLIDCFVPKGDPSLKAVIRERILRYQRAFIADETRLIRHALRIETYASWTDLGLGQLLQDLRNERDIVEYYAISDPTEGFLLVDSEGNGFLLLTFCSQTLEAQLASARLSGAPTDILDMLRRRQVALYFSDERGDRILDPEGWHCATVNLHPFPDDPECFFGLVEHCRPFDVSPETVLGLRGFLAGRE
jgi:CheY-like chemotaxis protein